MKHSFFATAVLWVVTFACAMAADWVYLGKSDDGKTQTFVDRSAVRSDGSVRRSWIKRSFASHTQRGTGLYTDKWAREVVGMNAYNCQTEQFRTESLIWYFEDGSDYATPAALFPGPWLPVGPDTVVRAEMGYLCRGYRG